MKHVHLVLGLVAVQMAVTLTASPHSNHTPDDKDWTSSWSVLKKFDLTSMTAIRKDWDIMSWPPGYVNDEMEAYIDSPDTLFVRNGALVVKAQKKDRACIVHSGHDNYASNLKSVNGQPVSACCGICRSTSGCKGWAWNSYQGGTCWLKKGTGPLVAKSGVTAGIQADLASGRIQSKAGFSPARVPGKKLRVEFVAKVPTVMGAWPALWMLGKSGVYGNWPQEGEIDVMEWVWQIQNKFLSSLHWKGPNDWSTGFTQLTMSELASQWTTFGVEYSAVANDEYIQYYMKTQSGVTHYGNRATKSLWDSSFHPTPACKYLTPGGTYCSPLAPFDNEMNLIVNLAVGGAWAGCCGVNSYAAFNSGVEMSVRSVTVYQNS